MRPKPGINPRLFWLVLLGLAIWLVLLWGVVQVAEGQANTPALCADLTGLVRYPGYTAITAADIARLERYSGPGFWGGYRENGGTAWDAIPPFSRVSEAWIPEGGYGVHEDYRFVFIYTSPSAPGIGWLMVNGNPPYAIQGHYGPHPCNAVVALEQVGAAPSIEYQD